MAHRSPTTRLACADGRPRTAGLSKITEPTLLTTGDARRPGAYAPGPRPRPRDTRPRISARPVRQLSECVVGGLRRVYKGGTRMRAGERRTCAGPNGTR